MNTLHSYILATAALAAWSLGASAAQAPVGLGAAGDFAILSKTGITTTGTTAVVGDIGVSPIDSTAITGFTLSVHASNAFATSPIVIGKVYASDYAVPTPSKLTTAVGNLENAYTDAAGRSLPDTTNLGAGDISGLTLAPGLHKWGTGVLLTSAVTFAGDADAVWILQIAEDLTVGDGAMVQLAGGAVPENIFWQVAGTATLGTTADFKGILLSQTGIHARTGATVVGRLLAQTAVTLDANHVAAPTAADMAWFGLFNDSVFDHVAGRGWILHAEHGWLYLVLGIRGSWFWDQIRHGWYWTQEGVYPLIHSHVRGEWERYDFGGTRHLRWFFLYEAGHADGGYWSAVYP